VTVVLTPATDDTTALIFEVEAACAGSATTIAAASKVSIVTEETVSLDNNLPHSVGILAPRGNPRTSLARAGEDRVLKRAPVE
jgi:hypothetical protein